MSIKHFFDIDIANRVGVNAAVIYENIKYWVTKNKANEVNYIDGHTWTYNSVKAFQKLFPYLSIKQIRTAISKLENSNLIKSAVYNQAKLNRVKWYCLVDEDDLFGSTHEESGDSNLCQKGTLQLPSEANQKCQKGTLHLPKRANHTPENPQKSHLPKRANNKYINYKDNIYIYNNINSIIDDTLEKGKREQTKEPKSSSVWLAYASEYEKRYGVKPIRNAKVNSLLCKIVDYVGKEEAIGVVKYYISLNDKWFLKKHHDIETLITNLQGVRTQMLTGDRKTTNDYIADEHASEQVRTMKNLSDWINENFD